MTPAARIESERPAVASWSKRLRGWRGLAWICSMATCASSCPLPPPIRTSKPRPRPRRGVLAAFDKLHRHLPVGLGTTRAPVVVRERPAVARRFGDAHGARNDRAEDEVAEMTSHLLLDLCGESRTRVAHRDQDAGDRKPRIEARPHEVDRVDEL